MAKQRVKLAVQRSVVVLFDSDEELDSGAKLLETRTNSGRSHGRFRPALQDDVRPGVDARQDQRMVAFFGHWPKGSPRRPQDPGSGVRDPGALRHISGSIFCGCAYNLTTPEFT